MKKESIATILFLLFSATTLCGCDFVYRLLQKEGAEEKKLVGELVPNAANPVIQEAQKLLRIFGQKTGRPDGKLGTKTRSAIANFQQQQGLKVSRFLDRATWERLHQFDGTGLVQNGDIRVDRLQAALKRSGQYKGKVDGKLGPQTLKAVSDFQTRCRLKADGTVGFQTLQALAKFVPAPESSGKNQGQ